MSSIVASEPAACRPILVDFVITGSHFSWSLLRHLPLSFLRKQQKSATHFQIEKSRPKTITNYSSSINQRQTTTMGCAQTDWC